MSPSSSTSSTIVHEPIISPSPSRQGRVYGQQPQEDKNTKRTAALLRARAQGGSIQPETITQYVRVGEHMRAVRKTLASRSVTNYIEEQITPLYGIGKTHTIVWETLIEKFGSEFLLDTAHLSIPSTAYIYFSQRDIPVDLVKQVIEEIRADMIPFQCHWSNSKIKNRLNQLLQDRQLAALSTDSVVNTTAITEAETILPQTPLQDWEQRQRQPRPMILVAARGTKPKLVSARGPEGEVCIIPEDCLPEEGHLPTESVQAMKRYVVTMANNFALYVSRQKVRANGAKGLALAQQRIQAIKQEQADQIEAMGRRVVNQTEVYAQERAYLMEYLRRQHYIVAEFLPIVDTLSTTPTTPITGPLVREAVGV